MSDVNDSDSGAGLARNSAVMAAGTIVSRITGVARDMAMTAALGFFIVSDAYSLGNTLPNIVYILVAGGALNAVFIPQLVRHMKSDVDGGKAFADRLLSVVGVALLVLSIAAVLVAPALVSIYATQGLSQAEYELAVAFARLCLPQIFFYGAYTMLQQVLNARGKFGAAMFAPIANNVVAIAVFLGFLFVAQPQANSLTTLSESEVLWLGLGTTAGVAIQALVLFPPLLSSGYRFSFRTDWRGAGLGKAGGLAVWTIALVLANQIGYAVTTRLATAANVAATQAGEIAAGLTTYQKAHLIFILPHSVITVSLVTALLPRLSSLAHDEKFDEIGAAVSRAARVIVAMIIPLGLLLAVAAPDISQLLFGNGVAGMEPARRAGEVVTFFALGLPAYSLVYVLYRAWYSMEDTKTPFALAVVVNVANMAIAIPLFNAVSTEWKIQSLAVAYSIAYTVTAVVAWVVLRRRIPLNSAAALRTIALSFVAAGIAALLCQFAIGALPYDTIGGLLLRILIVGVLGLAAFVAFARILGVAEVHESLKIVQGRLRK